MECTDTSAGGLAEAGLPALGGTGCGAAETAWRWVFLAGLSLAVGALVASATGQLDPSRQVGLARLGLIVASVGPAAVYGSSVSQGLSAGTVGVGVAALLLAIAALTATRQMAASVLTGVAILAWATRSHTATVGGLLGMLARESSSEQPEPCGASSALGFGSARQRSRRACRRCARPACVRM